MRENTWPRGAWAPCGAVCLCCVVCELLTHCNLGLGRVGLVVINHDNPEQSVLLGSDHRGRSRTSLQ